VSAAAARLFRVAVLAVLGWSLAVFVLAELGLGGRYVVHPDDPSQIERLPALHLARAESRLRPLDAYSVVAERPLFNPDRRPQPTADEGGAVEPPAPAEAPPLDLVLTSVILAGDTRIAVVAEPGGMNSQSVRLGQSLKGEQAAWQLAELHPRYAIFEGPTGRSRVDIRLFDGTGGQAPTPISVAPDSVQVVTTPEDPDAAEQTPESRAELIRKRIEERRRQMREEAARANQERGQ
jgi:general secretion pathway protein N